MEPTQAQLDAFIDGELPMTESRQIEALLVTRPDLAAYVERQHALRQSLAEAFAPVMDEPVPEHLRKAVYEAPVSPQFRARGFLAALSRTDGFFRLALPMAGALACGLLLGIVVTHGTPSPFRTAPGGGIVAQGSLARALNERLASDGIPQSGPRIGVSFANTSGEDCRSFTLPGDSASTAGVACHEGSDWVVAATASAPAASGTAYVQAGADMPKAVRDAIQGMISGAPFDAAAERAARERGWK
jgi:hypothetical protein